MNLESIVNFINNNAVAIVDNLEHETIEVHKFLIKEFRRTNVIENLPFQFLYRSFYRLDNAGLTPEFKKEYFKILEDERNKGEHNIKSILEKLEGFLNKKNQPNVQFSFATKLLNSIDSSIPIYDSEVARVFGYSRPLEKDFSKKVDKYIKQFEHIRSTYEKIIAENLLVPAVGLFDAKFKGHNFSEIKRLDFVFWSAGKIMKREKAKSVKTFKAVNR